MCISSSRLWHLLRVTWWVMGLSILLCQPAHADSGIPMILVVWPASWVLLLLIIPLETWVARRTLKLNVTRSLMIVSGANLVSTLVGIPLTWLALVVLQLPLGGTWGLNAAGQRITAVTVQSAWLFAYRQNLDWMLPVAAMVLCIPFFFMSVACEYRVAQRWVEKEQHQSLKQWSWKANVLSYGLIGVILGIRLLLVFHQRGVF